MQARFLAFLAFSIVAGLHVPAFALSCVEPVMTEKTIEEAEVIFEGTVTDVSTHGSLLQQLKGDMGKASIFTFKVTHSWKGAREGDSVNILRSTYWGDGFTEGKDYLVVAGKGRDGLLEAHLCGLSMPLEYSSKSLEFLKKHFAGAARQSP